MWDSDFRCVFPFKTTAPQRPNFELFYTILGKKWTKCLTLNSHSSALQDKILVSHILLRFEIGVARGVHCPQGEKKKSGLNLEG